MRKTLLPLNLVTGIPTFKLELGSEIFRTEHESEFFDVFGIEDLV